MQIRMKMRHVIYAFAHLILFLTQPIPENHICMNRYLEFRCRLQGRNHFHALTTIFVILNTNKPLLMNFPIRLVQFPE